MAIKGFQKRNALDGGPLSKTGEKHTKYGKLCLLAPFAIDRGQPAFFFYKTNPRLHRNFQGQEEGHHCLNFELRKSLNTPRSGQLLFAELCLIDLNYFNFLARTVSHMRRMIDAPPN